MTLKNRNNLNTKIKRNERDERGRVLARISHDCHFAFRDAFIIAVTEVHFFSVLWDRVRLTAFTVKSSIRVELAINDLVDTKRKAKDEKEKEDKERERGERGVEEKRTMKQENQNENDVRIKESRKRKIKD